MAFELTSSAFKAGDTIPRKYTCDGADVSPPLTWADPPAGTAGFALVTDDPDAPVGTWVHWVLYDLPAAARVLPEGVPGEATLKDVVHQASLIAAILSSEPPPISTIQRMAPPALDRLVKTCLAKDPEERWQSAHDVAAELKWIAEYADLHGILMAPHGTGDGLFGLAALVQVCATLPHNFIAFEYPIGQPNWWYDIVEGLPQPVVKNGFVDVDAWTRPGIGLDFKVEAARPHLRAEDADFFD